MCRRGPEVPSIQSQGVKDWPIEDSGAWCLRASSARVDHSRHTVPVFAKPCPGTAAPRPKLQQGTLTDAAAIDQSRHWSSACIISKGQMVARIGGSLWEPLLIQSRALFFSRPRVRPASPSALHDVTHTRSTLPHPSTHSSQPSKRTQSTLASSALHGGRLAVRMAVLRGAC